MLPPNPAESILHPSLASQINTWEANRGDEMVVGVASQPNALTAALSSRSPQGLQAARTACEKLASYADGLLALPKFPDPDAAARLDRGAELFRRGANDCSRMLYPHPTGVGTASAYLPHAQAVAAFAAFNDHISQAVAEFNAAARRIEHVTGRPFPASGP